MGIYEGFIPQSAAPKGAERIGIYDADGVRVGEIPLGSLRPKPKGERLYSFGILSDTHINEADHAHNKMVEAVLDKLCADNEIEFVCILGDVVNGSSVTKVEWWQAYKALIDQHASKPVFPITGNHDCIRNVLYGPYRNDVLLLDENGNVVTDEEGKAKLDPNLLNDSGMIKKAEEFINENGGRAKPYMFEHKGDVFIMLSLLRVAPYPIFLKDDVKAIYRMFEENRNKRCFVMTHYPPQELEDYDLAEKKLEGWLLLSLFQHYKNSVVFHGHTHGRFSNQKSDAAANYTETLGFRSVHTPMTCVDEGAGRAEAYIVDVYENGLHLRGYDFLKEQSVPLGTFWIDTPMTEIEAGTYADENGTIIKNKEG